MVSECEEIRSIADKHGCKRKEIVRDLMRMGASVFAKCISVVDEICYSKERAGAAKNNRKSIVEFLDSGPGIGSEIEFKRTAADLIFFCAKHFQLEDEKIESEMYMVVDRLIKIDRKIARKLFNEVDHEEFKKLISEIVSIFPDSKLIELAKNCPVEKYI